MSQLDSMLAQLKKTLSSGSEPLATPTVQVTVDPKSSQALKDFLAKKPSSQSLAKETIIEDPQIIIQRQKALSSFVGVSLSNNGKAILTGTIDPVAKKSESNSSATVTAAAEKQSDTPIQPFAPDPSMASQGARMIKPLPSAASQTSSNHANHGTTAPLPCPECAARNEADKKITGETKKIVVENQDVKVAEKRAQNYIAEKSEPKAVAPEPKKGMAALFAGFGGKKPETPKTDGKVELKPESESSVSKVENPKADTPKLYSGVVDSAFSDAIRQNSAPKANIIWFKHIQAVESALQIGDAHFAESLLSLLTEVAESLHTDAKILVRLKSLQARIFIERKMITDASKLLEETIRSIEGKPEGKDVAAAYCWRALAQCFNSQKETAKAEHAKNKSVAIAGAALGQNDPETMLFNAPL